MKNSTSPLPHVTTFAFLYFLLFFYFGIGLFQTIPFLPYPQDVLIRFSKYLHMVYISAYLLAILPISKILSRINMDKRGNFISWATLLLLLGCLPKLPFQMILLSLVIFVGFNYFESHTPLNPTRFGPPWLFMGILGVGVFYLSAATATPYAFNLQEDSMRMGVISQVLLGKTPYRDITHQFGVLSDVVRPLLAFKIFGVNYGADQIARGLISGVASTLVFLMAGLTVSGTLLSLSIGILMVWSGTFLIPERAIFLIISVWVSVFVLRGNAPNLTTQKVKLGKFLAGFFAAAQLLYSFDIGVTLALGVLLFAAFEAIQYKRWKPSLTNRFYAGGVLSGCGIFFIYLLIIGGLSGFIRDTNDLLFHLLPIWGTGYPSVIFSLTWARAHSPTAFVITRIFPLFAIGLALFFTLLPAQTEKIKKSASVLKYFACLLCGNFFLYLMHPDSAHYENSTMLLNPFYILLFFHLMELLKGEKPARLSGYLNSLSLLSLGSIFLYSILGSSSLSRFFEKGLNFTRAAVQKGILPTQKINSSLDRLGLATPSKEELARIEPLVKKIRERVPENGFYFDMTSDPLYFFANRKNPTRFPLFIYLNSQASIEICLRQLKENPPQAILTEKNFFPRKNIDILQPVFEWVKTHYQTDFEQEPYLLLKRNPPAG